MASNAPVEFRATPATDDCPIQAIETHASSLAGLKQQCPDLKIWTRASDKFAPLRATFNTNLPNHNPLAICRPTSVDHVSAIVRYAVSNNIDISVRAGGHDVWGRSRPQDALVIDLREMDSIELAADHKSVTIGGGCITENSAKFLQQYGLLTTLGGCLDVGQANWAMIGGYNTLCGNYGMGVDQIVSARIVDATGTPLEADAETLWGIRGAGGNFGIVTSLTLKVHSLPKTLAGMIGWPLQQAAEIMPKYVALLKDDFPNAFSGTLIVGAFPGKPAMIACYVIWGSSDVAAGRAYLQKVEALAPPMFNTVAETTPYNVLVENRVPYGHAYTVRSVHAPLMSAEFLAAWTARVTALPTGTAAGLSTLHFCHGAGAAANPASCFAHRSPHVMVEMIGMGFDEGGIAVSEKWVDDFWQELRRHPQALKGGYASLMGSDEPPRQAYGENWERLVELKRKKDPRNVFKHAIPTGLTPDAATNGVNGTH